MTYRGQAEQYCDRGQPQTDFHQHYFVTQNSVKSVWNSKCCTLAAQGQTMWNSFCKCTICRLNKQEINFLYKFLSCVTEYANNISCLCLQPQLSMFRNRDCPWPWPSAFLLPSVLSTVQPFANSPIRCQNAATMHILNLRPSHVPTGLVG